VGRHAGRHSQRGEAAPTRELDAIGDIALRFADGASRAVEHKIDTRIIGLTLDEIRQIRRVIGVVGGLDKHDALRAALHGGLIGVVSTDRESGAPVGGLELLAACCTQGGAPWQAT
jgi:DNA-binding transcriptional regulator LsrR (DeoR family)